MSYSSSADCGGIHIVVSHIKEDHYAPGSELSSELQSQCRRAVGHIYTFAHVTANATFGDAHGGIHCPTTSMVANFRLTPTSLN